MGGREEQYRPDIISMSMEQQAGIAVANKKLAERRIEKFKREIDMNMNMISRKSKT